MTDTDTDTDDWGRETTTLMDEKHVDGNPS